MTRQESEELINHFQAFLIIDGQIDIDPDEAIRNRDIFLNNYLASDGVSADVRLSDFESDYACDKCGSKNIDPGAVQTKRVNPKTNTCLDCGNVFE